RLPLVRAPLGIARGIPLPPGDGKGPRGPAHPRAERAMQAGPREDSTGHGAHAALVGRLGGHRLLRGRRRLSRGGRGAAPPAQGDRQRDSARLRDAPREAVAEPPHLAGGRGRFVAGRAGSRLRAPVESGALGTRLWLPSSRAFLVLPRRAPDPLLLLRVADLLHLPLA